MKIEDKDLLKDENPIDIDEKNRRKTIGLIIIILVIIISGLAYYLFSYSVKHKPPVTQEVVKTKTPDLLRETWLTQSSKQIESQEKELKELKNIVQKLQKQQQEKQRTIISPPTTTTSQSHKNKNKKEELSRVTQGYPSPPLPAGKTQQFTIVKQEQPQTQKPTERVLTNLIQVVKNEAPKETPKEEKKLGEEQKEAKDKNVTIPPGSFLKAIILNGIDAPAGGKAQAGPLPVLMRVTNKAQLPNFWKADLKSCFLVGEGYGDLSSERAYIRVNTLSCVTEGGKVLEKGVQGYAAGEDGKIGLQGRVVTKQGAMLARTLVAGFVEGVGRAFKQTSQNIYISPVTGTASQQPISPSSSEALRLGIGGGASKAAEKLAEFYMQVARQMFPVIEINAGREVDVILLKKVELP